MIYLEIYYLCMGLFYFIFGIVKTFICAINLLTTKENIEYLKKYFKFIINDDYTCITKIFFLVILIFSIFSFIKGVIYLNIKKNFISHNIKYLIYLLFGLFLIFSNILIIYYPEYTKMISRDNTKIDLYIKVYIGSGLLFLITVIFNYIYFEYKKMNILLMILLLLLFILLLMTMIYIGSFNYFEDKMKEELITFIMIPLGIM